jgi:hypothetical protein
MLDIHPSHYNSAEFCQGTVSEMLEGGEFVYDAIRKYARENVSAQTYLVDRTAHAHLRVYVPWYLVSCD